MPTPTAIAETRTVARPRVGEPARILPALFALALGVLVVGVTGFAHQDVVHNAAHDARHSSGFPCH